MSDWETEELIRESERLVSSVNDSDEYLRMAPAETGSAHRDSATMRTRLSEAGIPEPEHLRRGYASFSVSEDEMLVTGYFYPPEDIEYPVELAEVERKLESLGVIEGIEWETIRDAIWRCNTERREILDVAVARGREATENVPAHIGLRKTLVRKAMAAQKPIVESGRADWRSVSPFFVVEKDTVLARDMPEQKGEDGRTVLGRTIACTTRHRPVLKPGANVYKRGEYYRASVDGRFEWGKDYFRVNEVLELLQDVDYSTGHIDFPGDVILHKAVRDGFRIHAGGSVLCLETLDASDVRCGGDLVARRGIIGRNSATVEVGGSIEARYIENCRVSARGSIKSHVGIVNSQVSCLDTIETGIEGIIMGGKLTALSGLRAHQIGGKMGTRTEIRCGIDFEAQNRMSWIQDRSTQIAFRIGEIRTRKKRAGEKGNTTLCESLTETEGKLAEGLRKLQDAALALLDKLDKNDAAVVEATGYIHAAVYVEICHVGHQVEHPVRGVRLSLDKSSGRIKVERGSRAR